MSALQEQAVQMIQDLSDDNVSFLIELIQRFMISQENRERTRAEDEAQQAFRKLNAARAEIRQYIPEDFDPERELAEAREERYGRHD